MKKHHVRNLILLLSTAFAFLFSNTSLSQTAKSIQLLKQKFATSDSVVLISHQITEEYAVKIVPDWDSQDTSMNLKRWEALHPAAPKFSINGNLNKQIIIESVSLNDSGRIKLSSILLRQVNLKYWTPTKCDQPQHSIIFYNSSSQSYINICFGCHRIHSSKDIAFDEINMDEKKWAKLITFFKSHGLAKVFQEYDKLNVE